jgi:hypothetical protein
LESLDKAQQEFNAPPGIEVKAYESNVPKEGSEKKSNVEIKKDESQVIGGSEKADILTGGAKIEEKIF